MAILSDSERRAFLDDGFVVRPGLVPPAACEEACAQLSRRIEAVAREYQEGRRDEFHFLRQMKPSRDRLEVFWDLSSGGPAGRPAAEWERYVMRVGHALHRDDPVFARVCLWPEVVDAMSELLEGPLRVLQSAVIYKQPKSDAVFFRPHQDAWYLPCSPPDLALAFVALDDCDEENGCLEVTPGSHKHGLTAKLELGPDDFIVHGSPDPALAAAPRRVLPMRRGDVAFVHGLAYHASGPNRSPRPRRSLITHVAGPALRLDPMSWLQPPPGGFLPFSR